MIREQVGVLQLVLLQRGLLCCLIALGQCGGVRIGGLFELRGRNQVFARLRLVTIELLLRVHEAVLRGVELRLRAGGALLRVRRVEAGHDFADLDGVAEPYMPLDDLAGNPERQRRRVTRLYFARQRSRERAAVGMCGGNHHRARHGRCRLLLMACA